MISATSSISTSFLRPLLDAGPEGDGLGRGIDHSLFLGNM
jgi:hypothetical protein